MKKNYENGIDTIKSLIEEFDRHTNSVNTVGVCIPGFSSKRDRLG